MMLLNMFLVLSILNIFLVKAQVGPTFGTGLAGVMICSAPLTILNYTSTSSTNVLQHFWVTGAAGVIDRVWIEYYIDNETTPSISFQPAMMCGMGFPQFIPDQNYEYSAGGLCGKTAPVGGWSNTFQIPFAKNAIVTMRLDSVDGVNGKCQWSYVNIRGTVGMPLQVPGMGGLNNDARLILQKNVLSTRQPYDFVTIASLPVGTKGVIMATSWAVEAQPVGGPSAGGGYIEGCWNFYSNASEVIYPGLVVGTGVEDYFDSGYYFGADSGDAVGVLFANALSGLTLFQRQAPYERLSAYRFHIMDPLWMIDGGQLTWQVGAKNHPSLSKCGNPLPDTGTNNYNNNFRQSINTNNLLNRTLDPVNVTTYAWIYIWPITK